ncbi:MAG TPA: type II toxin-antitoxin system VapC family toxin [Armatimonadota bacterium]|nr:type II toxin-antitoxin system VapC family toxin [Armatimonadota bacterium]
MNLVLDANALVALIHNEPGGSSVADMLDDPGNSCLVHAVNLCEVYYDLARTHGEPKARQVIEDLMSGPLAVREDMDLEFWQTAGAHKARLRRVSLADCFCMSLAVRVGGDLVTADHHEFDPVQQEGICTIRFIR